MSVQALTIDAEYIQHAVLACLSERDFAGAARILPDELPSAIKPDSERPTEKWFLAIDPGDTPENSQVSAITTEWVEQWMRDNGQDVPELISVTDARAFARERSSEFAKWKSKRKARKEAP